MLKKFLIGTVVALALLVVTQASAADFGTTTLRVGSKGPAVVALQTLVGATADGSFGPLTEAKVKVWQAANGLVADGLFGIKSKTVANGGSVVVTPNNPNATCPAGFTCTANPGTTVVLTGGAGSIDITSTTSNVENRVKEGGDSTKVMAFKVEAIDSDIAVTSLKLVFAQTGDATSSEKLSNYVDSVDVYMGSTKVGSADASDFTRESADTPDTYSKTITLSNAVVKDGAKGTFYVEVTAISSIDNAALTDGTDPAEWTVGATDIRYQDATGVIMSGNDSLPTKAEVGLLANTSTTSGVALKVFKFEDVSTYDSIDVKSSSTNPDDATITVSDTSGTTDDVLALAFKLDVGDDSADVTVTDMMLTVDVTNFDTTGNTTVDASDDIDVSVAGQWADRIISALNVKVDGKTYEAELDANVTIAQDVTDGAGTVTYTVDFGNDLVIAAGETPTVEVLVTYNEQSATDYNDGVIVTTSLDAETDISAETSEDSIVVGGAGQTGADQTLSLSEATISAYRWVVNSTGSIVDFYFTVEATGDDFSVLSANILDSVDGTATVTDTGDLPETSDKGVLTKFSGDSVATLGGSGTETGFKVSEGDTTTFRVRYSLTGATNSLWEEVTITSIDGINVPEDKQTSPTATISYNI